MYFLDWFAGAGGLSVGLQQAGWRPAAAIELDEDCTASLRANGHGGSIVCDDARTVVADLSRGHSSLGLPRHIDLICGGPPCQGFSGYNRFRTLKDRRNDLVSVMLDAVAILSPSAVLLENVPGLLSIGDGKAIVLLLKALEKLGYSSSVHILQAGGYGIPQSRWRVFVVGLRGKRKFRPPEPTHAFPRMPVWGATAWRDSMVHPPSPAAKSKSRPFVTVGDAISDLPALLNGQVIDPAGYATNAGSSYQRKLRSRTGFVQNHGTKRLGELQLERVRHVPRRPMAGWLDLPHHLKPANLLRHGDKRYENRFGRLWTDGVFNTILTDAHLYWSRVIHYDQDRIVSVRESARAQSFPDDHVFAGTLSSQYRQIGNAVPPLLARALGRALAEALS